MNERDPLARTPAPQQVHPTRRELRTGNPSSPSVSGSAPIRAHRRVAAVTAPIPVVGSPRDPRFATVAHRSPGGAPRRATPAPAPTRFDPSASAELRRKSGMRRLICALAAVVTVPGLFATAALPAYSQTFSADPSFTSSVNGSQSLAVPLDAAGETISRSGINATSDEEMVARRLDNARAKRAAAYNASGATAAGDDYPWPYEAADVEGGGLSALGYYYRECVDFVAWRLNRDAGSTSGPWKYTWSYLTPNGGNASQWASNWRAHGWETGSEPVAGSVAWFNGNHVAYVKNVNDDGTVTIEEYNHGMMHKYGIRTIPASAIALFLYAPPL